MARPWAQQVSSREVYSQNNIIIIIISKASQVLNLIRDNPITRQLDQLNLSLPTNFSYLLQVE